jgi:hypothetical protein
VISNHNGQVPQNRRFTVGRITIPNVMVYRELNYETTKEVLESMCLGAEGGYFFFRKEDGVNYIDWLADIEEASIQPVKFGLNLVDISKDIKVEVFDRKQKVQIRSAFAKFNQNLVYNFNKDSLVEFTKGTIDDFEKMLNEYNEGKNEFNKKVIRFKCDKNKISGRAYSQYIKTEKDDIENGYATDRTDWCKENNLAYRYDIKSAVPRISHLMHTGTWKNEDFDFYEYMSKRMSEDSGMYLPRDYMKEIHMRLRFGQSPEKSFNDFCYSNRDLIRARYPSGDAYEMYLTNIRPNLLLDWRKLYNIVEELEGDDHSSAVFYFESFLELYVVWKLKQLGVTAYNIYDEFFYDKPYDIASIIEEGANYMYQKIRDYDDRFNIGKRSI